LIGREAEESAMVGWESLELEGKSCWWSVLWVVVFIFCFFLVFRQEQKEMIALKSELIKKWCSMSGCESMRTGVVIEPEKIIALFGMKQIFFLVLCFCYLRFISG
jgi:hypothetical protein